MVLLFNWDNLSTLGKVYWIIAVPTTAIFLILLILSFLGADVDHPDSIDIHDGGVGGTDGFGGFLINVKSILSFLMMFGWAGIISLGFKLSTVSTLIIAIITGLVTLILVAGLLYLVTRLSYDGTLNVENAIGKTGDVILHIPAKKIGFGQVQVNVQGALRTLDAVTEEAEEIKSGTKVLVVDVMDNNILLVVTKK